MTINATAQLVVGFNLSKYHPLVEKYIQKHEDDDVNFGMYALYDDIECEELCVAVGYDEEWVLIGWAIYSEDTESPIKIEDFPPSQALLEKVKQKAIEKLKELNLWDEEIEKSYGTYFSTFVVY